MGEGGQGYDIRSDIADFIITFGKGNVYVLQITICGEHIGKGGVPVRVRRGCPGEAVADAVDGDGYILHTAVVHIEGEQKYLVSEGFGQFFGDFLFFCG